MRQNNPHQEEGHHIIRVGMQWRPKNIIVCEEKVKEKEIKAAYLLPYYLLDTASGKKLLEKPFCLCGLGVDGQTVQAGSGWNMVLT